MTQTPVDEMSFEGKYLRWKKSWVIWNAAMSPEQSIALYERGAQLKQRCRTKLKEAEEKVALILGG